MRTLEVRRSELEQIYLDNRQSKFFAQYADCLYEEGGFENIERAIDILETGLRFYPTNAVAHFILAKCYHNQGNYRDAKNEFERSLKYFPTLSVAYKYLHEINELEGLHQVNDNLVQLVDNLDPYGNTLKASDSNTQPIDFSKIDSEILEEEPEDKADDLFEDLSYEKEGETLTSDFSEFEDTSESENSLEELDLNSFMDETEHSASDDDFLDITTKVQNNEDSENIISDDFENKLSEEKDLVEEKEVVVSKKDELESLLSDDDLADISNAESNNEREKEEKQVESDFFSLSEEELFRDDPEYLERIGKAPFSEKAIKEFTDLGDEENEIPEIVENSITDVHSASNDDLDLDFNDFLSNSEEKNTQRDLISNNESNENLENFFDEADEEKIYTTTEFIDQLPEKEVFNYDELSGEEKSHDIFSESSESEDNILVESEETVENKLEEAPKEETKETSKTVEPKEISETPEFTSARVLSPDEVDEEKIVKLEDYVENISKEPQEVEKNKKSSVFSDELLDSELGLISQPKKEKKKDDSPILSPTLGEIHMVQGRFQEARKIFEKILEKEPDNEKLKRKIRDIDDILNAE
jgi:tetratricopeptide (TPR) repeat protein